MINWIDQVAVPTGDTSMSFGNSICCCQGCPVYHVVFRFMVADEDTCEAQEVYRYETQAMVCKTLKGSIVWANKKEHAEESLRAVDAVLRVKWADEDY